MKNKGFTLVELLAVIVILGMLITIAVPNIIKTQKNTLEKMYDSKIKTIEKAATLYGQDNQDKVKDKTISIITIGSLVDNNYLKKEDNSCKVGDSSKYCIKDPRDNSSLDNKKVCLCIINKKPFAVYVGDGNCSNTVCKNN